MNSTQERLPPRPFFLKAGEGQRFCIFHSSHPCVPKLGAFLYVHPFGEEMNKSRRTVALQARALTEIGFDVLQIDLFGCGDSSGDFRDATWAIWQDDLELGCRWLEGQVGMRISLWGLRLGALLALEATAKSCARFDRIVLWQPILNGETFMTQFLRIRLANQMLIGDSKGGAETQELRKILANGDMIEVGGYEITPALAAGINALRMEKFSPRGCHVYWFEVIQDLGRPLPLSAARIAAEWKITGVACNVHPVIGAPFWGTQEIAECPSLITSTLQSLMELVL